MLALVDRPPSRALRQRSATVDPELAEIFFNAAWTLPGAAAEIRRPQRYEELARKYGAVVWVYAAINRKAEDVASVPVRFVKRADDAGLLQEVPQSHPLRRLLGRPNAFMTWIDLCEATSSYLDIAGNTYWLKFTDRAQRPAELWPIRPELVTILGSATDYIGGYRIRAGREIFDFLPDQVVHFKKFNPTNDYYGLGALTAVWNESVIEEEAEIWNRNILRNAGRLDGLLTSDQALNETQAKQNAERFREMFSGPRNAGTVMVLGKGLSYKAVATSPKELDFVLSRKLSREAILAAIGVRPVILGLEAGDIGRRSEQIRDYFQSTVGSRIKRICAVANEFIVPDFQEPGLQLDPDVEQALMPYEDRYALAQADSLHIQHGIQTPNEIRARKGMPPARGGDVMLVSSTLVPIGQLAMKPGQIENPVNVGVRPAWLKAIEDTRGQLWAGFLAKTAPSEASFAAVVEQALRATGSGYARIVRDGADPHHVLHGVLGALSRRLVEIAHVQLPTALRAGFEHAVAMIQARQGKRIKDNADLGLSFDLEQPDLADYLRRRPVQYADLVTVTLAGDLRELLVTLTDQGASIAQIADAITARFDSLSHARALLIARTEVISASNLATLTAYQQSGVVTKSSWLTARDERVRPTHQEADGQIRALGEPFDVGGAQLLYPGDPAAPIQEIAMCRCTLLPELD